MPHANKVSWRRKLARRIVLLDGTQLATLHDAAGFITALPESRQTKQWNDAVARLLKAADTGSLDDIAIATRAVELVVLQDAE